MDINKSNSSQEEIKKFNELANEWWDPKGGFESLHKLNPLRFEYIKNATSINNKKCIDVGCGGGILTESLATDAKHVDGIDLAQKALNIAKIHQENAGIKNIKYWKHGEKMIYVIPLSEGKVATLYGNIDSKTALEIANSINLK